MESKFKDITNQIDSIINGAINGELNEIEVYARLSALEKHIKLRKETILESAINEFETYGENTLSLNGFEISRSQSGRYSFDHIQEWVEKNKELKEIEKTAKQAYKMSLDNSTVFNESTGEIATPAHYQSSKTSLKIKRK